MKYGVILNCSLPKDLKKIHDKYIKYLKYEPHVTICYLNNISLEEINQKLRGIKKFKIDSSSMTVIKKTTLYKINNNKNINTILSLFANNISAIPSKGFHMSIMYSPTKLNDSLFNAIVCTSSVL